MVRRWFVLVFVLGLRATAQIPSATSAELTSLAARAQVIFTGQVAAIDRNDAAGFVDIHFRILQSLRGAPASGTYVLREWSGLWIAHPERYQVGRRLLMLLPARGPAGFSAPLGDTEGAIPLIPTGSAAATSSAPLGVDLRWIESHAQRTIASSSIQPRLAVQAGTEEWIGPIAPLTLSTNTAQPVPLASVIALLGGSRPSASVPRGPANAR